MIFFILILIIQECWDKDQFTNDDFMGSLAYSSEELHIFEVILHTCIHVWDIGTHCTCTCIGS